MPNIEIHGFPFAVAKELEREIFCVFQKDKVYKEMVVTICIDDVRDCERLKQPFLRVLNSEKDRKERIRVCRILQKNFNIDIELMPLERFFPRKT
jgi:hypothetical protein